MLYCTPQIFARAKNNTGNMYPLGSGVLLRNPKGAFLISARHVYEKLEKYDLFMPALNGFLQIIGKWKYVNHHRRYDNIDIGILRLDDRLIPDVLSSYKFIMSEVLKEVDETAAANLFIAAGFPASQTKGREEILFQLPLHSSPNKFI